VGIVLSPRLPARSAILRAGGRTRVVGIGETAFGGTVAAIEADSVSLDFASGRVRLRLSAGAPSAVAAAAPPAAPPPAEGGVPAVTLERREVERRLGEESSRILAETTLVPAMDEGRVAGFTITRMPAGSLLSDAGLRPGDVLTEVDGVPIESLATLIGLWPRLQAANSVHAIVLRNGQPVALSVALR
jgi:type II secretory pathway component PulC